MTPPSTTSQRKRWLALFTVIILLIGACPFVKDFPVADLLPIPLDTSVSPQNQPTTPAAGAAVPAGGQPASEDWRTIPGTECIPQNNQGVLAQVVLVVDGDTIKVDIGGQQYTVRYVGVDTPETVAPNRPVEYMGPEASAKNKALVSGKQVILVKDISETDKYGRLLRFVIVDGIFVNRELVRLGYAQTITYPPDISCKDTFRKIEQEAKSQQVGLWAPNENFAPCKCDGPDLDCSDFDTQAQAQLCFDYCGGPTEDPFRLLRGDSPLVCTSLP
ncbi:MAG: hypothetical protein Fur0018_17760 [Anaerolineales bacterium]